MTIESASNVSQSVAATIESRFSDGMGTVTDLGIEIACAKGRLKHMLLPYRDDLCVEVGQGMPANLGSTLLDTAFGLDVMLYADVMLYTATIDFSTTIISQPKPNYGLIATCEVLGTNGASVIMRGEVREIETGQLVLTGQGNFLYNRASAGA